MHSTRFSGKICVITGGAGGLGLEMGRQLAAVGATLILLDKDAHALARADNIARRTYCVDVTDSDGVGTVIESISEEFGRIDFFFNNAGLAIAGEIRDLSLEHWRRVIEVNLMGQITCLHHVYPIMIAQNSGHIVTTCSGFGMAPGPLNSPYVASKFAMFGVSHALAAEARAFGISVSIACPGYIETDMLSRLQTVKVDPEALRAQLPAKPIPVAHAAQVILNGVARRKRVIAFPFYVWMLTALHRLFPPGFERFAAGQIANFRKIRG